MITFWCVSMCVTVCVLVCESVCMSVYVCVSSMCVFVYVCGSQRSMLGVFCYQSSVYFVVLLVKILFDSFVHVCSIFWLFSSHTISFPSPGINTQFPSPFSNLCLIVSFWDPLSLIGVFVRPQVWNSAMKPSE